MQGTYEIFALNTKLVIKQRQFQTLPMPDSMIKTIKAMDQTGHRGELIFANNKGIPYTWNRGKGQVKPVTCQQDTPYPALSVEFPGIVVEQLQNDQAENLAYQQEQEALEVIETVDLDREIPHLKFGNRDPTLDDNHEGNVDMVPLDRINEQQLINDVLGVQEDDDDQLVQLPTQDEEDNSDGSVTDLIADMNTAQQHINDVIGKIQEMNDDHHELPTC